MAMLWLTCLLMVLFSPHPSDGLSCVNDFVNKVSCTWDGAQVGRQVHCYVLGIKNTWELHVSQTMNRSCTLEPLGGYMRGCSLAFEGKRFSCAEEMPGIQVVCDNTTVDQLTPYMPCDHIQMNPPAAPNVNETVISWNQGRPVSIHFENFDFAVQIKHNDQTWKEARTLPTQDRELDLPSHWKPAGLHQVRVRVRPSQADYSSTWSNWSPVTWWETTMKTTMNPIPMGNGAAVGVPVGLAMTFVLFFALLILIFSCRLQSKSVPDPSKYFQGLSALHGEKWLTPYSASDVYFIAQSSDSISPVEVVAAPPSTSSSSSSSSPSSSPSGFCESSITVPLVPSPPPSSAGRTTQDSSSFCYISSVSSSFFYSSSSASSSASSTSNPSLCISNPSYHHDRVGPPAAVATGSLCDPCHHGNGTLRDGTRLPPTLAASQSIGADPQAHHQRELQGPNLGISFGGPKYPADEGMDKGWEEEDEELRLEEEEEEEEGCNSLWEHGLRRVFRMASRISSAAPPEYTATQLWPPPPSPVDNGGDDYDDDVYEYEDGDGARLPVGGTMGRASSMPVEPPCNRGYHTLNDLETTYSSKSI